MARFRGTLKGNRGETSRLGSKDAGLVGTVSGWNIGVRVRASDHYGADVIELVMTGGSNGNCFETFLGAIIPDSDNGGKPQFIATGMAEAVRTRV